MRSTGIAYVLWFFFGVLGVHRFYCGRIGTGILWFLTGGLFLIGWIVDAFLIPDMVDEANRESRSYPYGGGQYQPAPTYAPAPVAKPMPPAEPAPGIAHGYRVVFCTQCGGPMQVPTNASGQAFGCPACHTVLEVPT